MAVLLVKLLGRLPLSVLYSIVAPTISFLLFTIAGYRKKTIRDNLAKAMPDLSDQQRAVIAKDYRKHVGQLVVEILHTRYHSEAEVKQRVTFRNPELIEQHWQQGSKVIIMALHQSNWEWLLHAVAVQFGHKLEVVYKPLHNKGFDQYFKESRERFGCVPIPHKKVLEAVGHREDQYFFGILSDQSPLKKSPKVWAGMMGIETAFPIGVEVIAKKGQATVVFCGMHKVKRGHYECWFEEIATPPYAKGDHSILEGYADCCTRAITAQPETWLWSNQRWRFDRSEDRYQLKPEHDI
ncbi:KDO2-lipid IV(A) lauroyltransferase [Sinobacterium caligoides]|uniref:KDO2-lipid IV(A) lauroyltransferase n=1 Tax=Sinobacterium caligoides TaxID=933926 RepID=A0A3N2DXT1_9GAMM|nr:lysophospholipid acyltransferase family protein [Sinobacterium caligoides]ROS04604.1 KDO2-lipid IV(A) lauroyltransferase [Sinobacterium caligoides]